MKQKNYSSLAKVNGIHSGVYVFTKIGLESIFMG